MTKSKQTKRALLASVLSMVLCVAMLVGSTFAWFTDTAGSKSNKIKSGNLRINLLGRDQEAGGYNPEKAYEELSDEDKLFNAETKWEPGKVYYRELKVVNEGNLAAKFSVNIDNRVDAFKYNMRLDPNPDYTKDGENGEDYLETWMSLMEVVRVAVFKGSYKELVDLVNNLNGEVEKNLKEMEDSEKYSEEQLAEYASYLTEREYKVRDRDVLERALLLDTLLGTEDADGHPVGRVFSISDGFLPTDPDNGPLLEGTVKPKGTIKTDKVVDPSDPDGKTEIITTHEDEQVFTVIAYWQPSESDVTYVEGKHELNDDDYNLKNGRMATELMSIEDANEYVYKTGDTTLGRLQIEFDILVLATQAPVEVDSFGSNYDKNAWEKVVKDWN